MGQGERHGARHFRFLVDEVDLHAVDDGRELVELVELALLRALPGTGEDDVIDFVDAICTSIFERAAEGEILGAQIVFSAYSAFERGALPAKVRPTFFHWKKKPAELVAAVRAIEADTGKVRALIDQCLAEDLDPPLAPTTRAELEALKP